MALHDNRLKRLHLRPEANGEWIAELSERENLGAVDPDSIQRHSVEYPTAELTQRISDHAWSFRTQKGPQMLFLAEFQSSTDALIVLRQAAYAMHHLLVGFAAGTYKLDPVLPQPLLLCLYTGASRWQPRTLADLFGASPEYKLPFPWYYYDMRHMAAEKIPDRPLLHTLFEIERIEGPRGDAYAAALRPWMTGSAYTDLQRALIEFGISTLARWTLDNRLGWTPGQLDEEWSRITTLEELIMAETMVRTRMDALLAESEARGEAKGHRQALLALLANAKLTPSDLALCRQGLECMTREQMPTIGDILKAMGASDGDPTSMVQMCQPPEHSASNDFQGAR